MIQIRPDVFETNSSSTHSLIILNDYKHQQALKAIDPELARYYEEIFKDSTLTYSKRKEIFKSFKDLGATVDEVQGIIDLTSVAEDEYNFGYTGPIAYVDFAHKIMFVLTMLDQDGWGCSCEDYYNERLQNILKDLGINQIIPPKNGWTGIDHQSRDEIEYQVKFDIENFLLRKDYVLFLDHD